MSVINCNQFEALFKKLLSFNRNAFSVLGVTFAVCVCVVSVNAVAVAVVAVGGGVAAAVGGCHRCLM